MHKCALLLLLLKLIVLKWAGVPTVLKICSFSSEQPLAHVALAWKKQVLSKAMELLPFLSVVTAHSHYIKEHCF